MSLSHERLSAALADRYRIERQLGQGGMATVYLAQDLKHHRPVAIKVLAADVAHVLGTDRFLREIEVAAALDHPHILPLHDSGEADSFLYYVMPYVAGESLRERLEREKQLPLEDALQIAREVADALAYAHGRGVVHRDIKPENILLAGGHARVADFGIARAVTAAGDERLTETGLAMGTPAYMSPEQSSGDHEVDGRSDIYSLGCVLYEMLAGEPPYTGPSAQAVIAKRLSEPLPRISVVRDAVPAPIERALAKALAKTPADRFATAAQLGESLTSQTTFSKVDSRRAHLNKGVALALAILVALLVGGKLFFDGEPHLQVERLAVLPLANLTGDPDQEYLVEGVHGALISTLSKIDSLVVIPRTSVMRYRGSVQSIPEIARELRVDAVLEGSILPAAAESVRIQLELIASHSQRRMWGKTFSGALTDLLGLHNDVLYSVVREIQVTLTPDERRRLSIPSPVSREVQEAVLRGQYHLNRSSVEGFQRATRYFEKALAADSSYAPAFLGLAKSYQARGAWWGDLTPVQAMPAARTAVEQALQLDSTLAEAYAVLGALKFQFYWDWEGAEAAFRTAIRLHPSAASVHVEYANFLRARGRVGEAREHIERGVDLDPLSAGALAELAITYSELGERDLATAAVDQALDLDPAFPPALWVLGMQHAAVGELPKAIEVLERGGDAFSGYLATLYVMAHREAEARQILRRLELQGRTQMEIAMVHAALGSEAEAIDWLERGYREREASMVWLGKLDLDFYVLLHPLQRLRSNPRVQELLQRLEVI